MGSRPVLVVDDDPLSLTVMAELLELEGYPVATARDGAEALQAVTQMRPSLVVTDLHMPTLDGAALVDLLHRRGYDPPILVVTATTRRPEQVAAAIGADAGLPKPIDIAAFLDLVAHLRVP
jgi:CheY-like chemotaxis protein